jgi:DNA-binding beta-propeller fold protein YncE
MSKLKLKLSALVALAVVAMAGTAQAQPFVYALGKVRIYVPAVGAIPSSEHQLHVIDAATNRLVAITTFGQSQYSAIAMSPDGARVYVGDNARNGDLRGLSVVSTRTHKVEDTWPESVVGQEVSAMAVSPDSRRLYVASYESIGGRVVLAIDVATKTRVAKWVIGSPVIVGVAVSPDGSRLYIATTDGPERCCGPLTNKLMVVNTTTFGVIAEIPLSSDAGIRAVSLSADGRFAYLSRYWVPVRGSQPRPDLSGMVEMVDTTTHTVVASIPFFGESPRAVAESPDGAAVYVPSITDSGIYPRRDAIHRLDPSTHAVAGKTSVPYAGAVAFLPDSSRAYVAADDKVVVLDTATHTVLATIGGFDYVKAIVTTPAALNPEPTPSAPTVTVSVSGTTAHLSWTPAAGPPALSYILEAGTASGLSNVFNGNVGNTTQLSAAAPPGTYYVRVRAVNAVGPGAASTERLVTIGGPAGCTPPASPNLSGGVAGGTASVAWPAVAGATSYVLSAGTTQGGTEHMPPTNLGANTGASASGLPAGFTAWVRVVALNACGQQSAPVDLLVR